MIDLRSFGRKGPNNKFVDAQFSPDGKYLLFREINNNSDPTSNLIIIDLETRKNVGITPIGKSYSLYNDVIVADGGNGLYHALSFPDLNLVSANLKHVWSDATSSFAAFVRADNTIAIFLPESSLPFKILDSTIPGLTGRIVTIENQWVNEKVETRFVVDHGSGQRQTQYVLEANGNFVQTPFGQASDYYLGIGIDDTANKVFMSSHNNTDGDEIVSVELDTSLGLVRVYHHPEFPLIIDETDPNNKIAIDPMDPSIRIPFNGKVVFYNPIDKSLVYERLGEHYWYNPANNNAKPIHLSLYFTSTDGKAYGVFELTGMTALIEFNSHKGGHLLGVNYAQDYRPSHFDGSAIVFSHPSGEVVRVDPNTRQELERIQPNSRPAASAQVQPKTQIPSELAKSVTIARENGNVVLRSQTESYQIGQLSLDNLKHVNLNTIAIMGNGAELISADQNGKITSIPFNTTSPIVEIRGNILLFENGTIVDTSFPQAYFGSKGQVSEDGQLSIREDADGTIYIFDHRPGFLQLITNEEPQPAYTIDATNRSFDLWHFDEKSKTLITRHPSSGQYMLGKLIQESGTNLRNENLIGGNRNATNIQIDSTGTVAIVTIGDKKQVLNLITGAWVLGNIESDLVYVGISKHDPTQLLVGMLHETKGVQTRIDLNSASETISFEQIMSSQDWVVRNNFKNNFINGVNGVEVHEGFHTAATGTSGDGSRKSVSVDNRKGTPSLNG